MSNLKKIIRKKLSKEQYLSNLISNLENLIKYSYTIHQNNNINSVFLIESDGNFDFYNNGLEKIKELLGLEKNIFLFDQESLNYANVLWDIILKIVVLYDRYNHLSTHIFDIDNSGFSNKFSLVFSEKSIAVSSSINASENYLINFNDNHFQFYDEKYLIDTINDEFLSTSFFLYVNSKTFEEKENSIAAICKKVVFLFEEKKSPKGSFELIQSKLGGKDKTLKFCGMMHVLRHTINDSKGEETKEHDKLNKAEKEKIFKEIFVDLLYILASLRIKDLLPKI